MENFQFCSPCCALRLDRLLFEAMLPDWIKPLGDLAQSIEDDYTRSKSETIKEFWFVYYFFPQNPTL